MHGPVPVTHEDMHLCPETATCNGLISHYLPSSSQLAKWAYLMDHGCETYFVGTFHAMAEHALSSCFHSFPVLKIAAISRTQTSPIKRDRFIMDRSCSVHPQHISCKQHTNNLVFVAFAERQRNGLLLSLPLQLNTYIVASSECLIFSTDYSYSSYGCCRTRW